MKLLDYQGRLFSKVSLIDLFILCGLSILVPTGYFVYSVSASYIQTKVFDVQPAQVILGTHQVLTIAGRRFSRQSEVQIGDRPYQGAIFLNSTRLQIPIPDDLSLGTYTIRVRDYRTWIAQREDAFDVVHIIYERPTEVTFTCLFTALLENEKSLFNPRFYPETGYHPELPPILKIVTESTTLAHPFYPRHPLEKSWSHPQEQEDAFMCSTISTSSAFAQVTLVAIGDYTHDPPVLSYAGQWLEIGAPFRIVVGGVPLVGRITSSPVILKILPVSP